MNSVEKYIDDLPTTPELRKRLAENQHERDLLKRLLKLAEDRERLKQTANGGVA